MSDTRKITIIITCEVDLDISKEDLEKVDEVACDAFSQLETLEDTHDIEYTNPNYEVHYV